MTDAASQLENNFCDSAPSSLSTPRISYILALVLFSPLLNLICDFCWRLNKNGRSRATALYVGEISHVRFKPTIHAFSYPIFFSYIDLDEYQNLFRWYLWPLISYHLPAIARFNKSDHLKDVARDPNATISDQVRDFVAATTGKRPDGPIRLLTHLQYFGYCFNPVSFYYIFDKDEKLHTVIGEVSNTPWIEMHSYVLSSDLEGVQRLKSSDDVATEWHRFRFKKEFHVSPFMDMDHTYDWTFSSPSQSLYVKTEMVKSNDGNEEKWFQAILKLKHKKFTAASLLWCMIKYPLYTVSLQVWIHWQALLLWRKDVPFYSHPQGSETTASRIISAAMTPLFLLRDKIVRYHKREH